MVVRVVADILPFFVVGLALILLVRERRRTQNKLRVLEQSVSEARALLTRRGDLAQEVAHEIKNPITAILCSAETLDHLLGHDLKPEYRESLRYIIEYGDSVLRVLSDYIDVSRCESGTIQPEPQNSDLLLASESVVGLLRAMAQRKRIRVDIASSERELSGFVDPRIVRQILFNLLHNALKYTPQDGAVRILLHAEPGTKRAIIEVEDTGPGMSPELLARVFDPYVSAGQSDAGLPLGTGLGLGLVKSLVELSGGEIQAMSSPGVGTTIYFWIPLGEPQPADLPGPKRNEKLDQPLLGQAFLVVDDDAVTRESISRLIRAWGGMVDQVSQATEALRALEERRYDAVMIEGSSDDLEGVELARTMRDSKYSDQTTVIVTARTELARETLAEAGVDQLLEKPFNGSTLLESLLASGNKHQTTH